MKVAHLLLRVMSRAFSFHHFKLVLVVIHLTVIESYKTILYKTKITMVNLLKESFQLTLKFTQISLV